MKNRVGALNFRATETLRGVGGGAEREVQYTSSPRNPTIPKPAQAHLEKHGRQDARNGVGALIVSMLTGTLD